MNKKNAITSIIILLAVIGVAAIIRLASPEDSWVCENGNWVAHGQPASPAPNEPCGAPPAPPAVDIVSVDESESADMVRLLSPIDLPLASPLSLAGEARGNWYFEGSFPVRLEDRSGQVLAQGVAQAEGEWMTEEYVPFKFDLVFAVDEETEAELVLTKDNPSGLPEFDDEIRKTVRLLPGEEPMGLQLFFLNDKLDPDVSCNKVFAVKRSTDEDTAVGRKALEILLEGPSEAEEAAGYYSSIPAGAALLSLDIQDGIAKADFNEKLDEGIGGSCLVTAIRTQITETLKQFPTVEEVQIGVNGEYESSLQP